MPSPTSPSSRANAPLDPTAFSARQSQVDYIKKFQFIVLIIEIVGIAMLLLDFLLQMLVSEAESTNLLEALRGIWFPLAIFIGIELKLKARLYGCGVCCGAKGLKICLQGEMITEDGLFWHPVFDCTLILLLILDGGGAIIIDANLTSFSALLLLLLLYRVWKYFKQETKFDDGTGQPVQGTTHQAATIQGNNPDVPRVVTGSPPSGLYPPSSLDNQVARGVITDIRGDEVMKPGALENGNESRIQVVGAPVL